jgi:hypothetical protein
MELALLAARTHLARQARQQRSVTVRAAEARIQALGVHAYDARADAGRTISAASAARLSPHNGNKGSSPARRHAGSSQSRCACRSMSPKFM